MNLRRSNRIGMIDLEFYKGRRRNLTGCGNFDWLFFILDKKCINYKFKINVIHIPFKFKIIIKFVLLTPFLR